MSEFTSDRRIVRRFARLSEYSGKYRNPEEGTMSYSLKKNY